MILRPSFISIKCSMPFVTEFLHTKLTKETKEYYLGCNTNLSNTNFLEYGRIVNDLSKFRLLHHVQLMFPAFSLRLAPGRIMRVMPSVNFVS
jgi:hypothetical protein